MLPDVGRVAWNVKHCTGIKIVAAPLNWREHTLIFTPGMVNTLF